MSPSLVSFIACLNIGWGLPLIYANGVAWHFPWIALGIFISMACHFVGVYLMRRLFGKLTRREQTAVISLGYWVAPILAYCLVLLMVKLVATHHGIS
jgi:hypothetical protein